MFGSMKPAELLGIKLAVRLDANRSRFAAGLPLAGGKQIEPNLRGFQVYCMRATTAERGYTEESAAVLCAAIDALLAQGDRDFVEKSAQMGLQAFAADQNGCR